MIRMISSANFKNSDAKANFPADSRESDKDDFAALLDGMALIIPPVIRQPVKTSAELSPEERNEKSAGQQNSESFTESAVQPLPQFNESLILPENFAPGTPKEVSSGAAEKLFASVEGAAENAENTATVQLTPQVMQEVAFGSDSLPEQFVAGKDFSNDVQSASAEQSPDENSKEANPEESLFAQIDDLQAEGRLTDDGKSDFKIAENQLRPEICFDDKKSETPNKLPRLFREVSGFFEVSDSAVKNPLQTAETPASAGVEGSNVAAQIEPQIIQMMALALKTGKPQILKMRLNPADLGGVEIKIEKDAAGRINAFFNTEKEETRKILTENIAQLRDSLKDSGWQIERVEVSCDSPAFAGNEARESSSQANEYTAQKSLTQISETGGSLNHKEDLNSEKSDRLLSVRA